MDAKISITTFCNAQCKTCPVWTYQGHNMTYDNFVKIYDALNNSEHVHRILLNSTGDMYIHPDRERIFNYIESNHKKWVCMTTNAAMMDRVPAIDEMIISFNGLTREGYEETTGLSFDQTIARIRKYHDKIMALKNAEIHCLVYNDNQDNVSNLLKIFEFWEGKIRISYKYDNQFKTDKTVDEYKAEERVVCDYLYNMTIMPNGNVISCAHDFESKNVFDNILVNGVDSCIFTQKRMRMIEEQSNGIFKELCERCNYNTPIQSGKIFYIKDRKC